MKTHVDYNSQFSNVFNFGGEQLPHSLLLISLAFVQLVVIVDDLCPVVFQMEWFLVVMWSAARDKIRQSGKSLETVTGQQLV